MGIKVVRNENGHYDLWTTDTKPVFIQGSWTTPELARFGAREVVYDMGQQAVKDQKALTTKAKKALKECNHAKLHHYRLEWARLNKVIAQYRTEWLAWNKLVKADQAAQEERRALAERLNAEAAAA